MIEWAINLISATDDALLTMVTNYGVYTYLILFLIIYAETGLLAFPFLPGDGLLFSIGVISGLGNLHLGTVLLVLIFAAILGNLTSYLIGCHSRYFVEKSTFLWMRKYLAESEAFYAMHGGMAIVLGRFLPIVRTYVPVVAGLCSMPQRLFAQYTVIGAVTWVCTFVLLGHLLGEIEWVKHNYGFIFLGLIILTILPIPLKYLFRIISR
jgi:membrane-associated protein